MMDGLKARLAAVERKAAEADGAGLPTFYGEEHLAALLERLGLPHSPAALAAAKEELERGGELRERWLAEHRWPASFWTTDDWNL